MTQTAGKQPRALDLLLGGVAHDLNNVFSQVLMITELLAAEDLDPELADMLEGVRESVRRGIGMADQLYDQSTAEDGDRLPVSLKQLASALQKRSVALIPGASVSARYPEAVPLARLDPQAILDVVLAVARERALERPGCVVEVIVEEHQRSDGRRHVSLAVSAPKRLAVEDLDLGVARASDDPLLSKVGSCVAEHEGWLEPASGAHGPLLRICLPTVGV